MPRSSPKNEGLTASERGLPDKALEVAMDLFDYPRAATIILSIFALVVLIEQAGSLVRGRIIEGR